MAVIPVLQLSPSRRPAIIGAAATECICNRARTRHLERSIFRDKTLPGGTREHGDSFADAPTLLGGDAPGTCQVIPEIQVNTRIATRPGLAEPRTLRRSRCRRRPFGRRRCRAAGP